MNIPVYHKIHFYLNGFPYNKIKMSNMLYVLNVFSCIFLKFYIQNDSIEHLGKILAYNFWDRKTELEEVKWLAYDPVVQLVTDIDPPVLNQTFFFPLQHINPQQQTSRQIHSQMTSWINRFCKCETLQDKLEANLMGIIGLGPYLPIPIIPVSTTGVHNLEKTLYTSL